MKLKYVIILGISVLSVTLIFTVDEFHAPYFSLRGMPAGYELMILRNFFNHTNIYDAASMVSAILLTAMIVLVRRVYTGRLKRLLLIAAPILIAEIFHYLLFCEIDAHFHYGTYLAFIDLVFSGLFGFLLYWVIASGLIMFTLAMLTCYPIGIMIDKLLLYITNKTPKHTHG